MREFSNYWNAITFATQHHGIALRKNGKIPYIVHPLRITAILRAAGFSEFESEDLMIGALFHDLVEDTNVTIEDIRDQFGEKVALIVGEVSKPNQGTKEEWLKSFDKVSKEAQIVKMADRIDNLMDMNIIGWSNEKTMSYAQQAKIILEKCGGAHSGLASQLKKTIEKVLKSL